MTVNSNAFKLLKYYITQSSSRRSTISRASHKCNNNIHILNFSTCSKRVNSAVLQPAKKLFSLYVLTLRYAANGAHHSFLLQGAS